MASNYFQTPGTPTMPTLPGTTNTTPQGSGFHPMLYAERPPVGAGAQTNTAGTTPPSYFQSPANAGTTGPTMANGQPMQPGERGTAANPQSQGYFYGRTWINTGPNAGGTFMPTPAPGDTNRADFHPIQFPGEGPGTQYVDKSSEAWANASKLYFAPNDPLGAVWNAIPDYYKVDIGNWDPQFRTAWLTAMARGDTAGADKVQTQWRTYQQSNTQQNTQQQQAQAKAQQNTLPARAPVYFR